METGTAQQRVGMLLDARGANADAALARLRAVLDDGAVTDADSGGVFEVVVPASSFEAGLEVVWNAVAAAGVDDEIRFAEHPDLAGHWRRRAGGGQ
jgi:hypothetical protein